jgi:hypothetical protein
MDDGFIRRHVKLQRSLVNAPNTTQVGPERRTSPRAGVAVDLAAAIAVLIPRPRVHRMTDWGMQGRAPPRALPLVGRERWAVRRAVRRHEGGAGRPLSMVANPEAWRTCGPRDEADPGWTIVGVGPVPAPLLGPPTGRIIRGRG